VSPSTEKVFTFGDGDVLELEHPACIRRLMLKGAPNDQEYVQANHTVARYVISSGLNDADGAAIAAEMATHTVGHKTTKNEFDRVHNFRTCMSSARSNPGANQFACSYVWGSLEHISGNLCAGCEKNAQNANNTGETAIPTDQKKAIRARALYELQHGKPFEYFFDEYQKLHASDATLGKVTLLGIGGQSVLTTRGIFPKTTGDSGKGKTHGKMAVLHLVPQEYVLKSSLSDKALFYVDLKDETILFLDDKTLSENLEELARCMMSDFQEGTQHINVSKDGKPQKLNIPPRCMLMFTNVDSSLHLQTANRTVDVSVDTSESADLLVHDIAVQHSMKGAPLLPLTFDVTVCREMLRIIKDDIGPFRVSVPYADHIIWPRKETRRNFPIFLDLIQGFAAFRCMQRQTREGVVFANVDDFTDAVALYKSLSKTQTSKLTEREWLVLQAIFDKQKCATLKELVESLSKHHLKYDTIRDILKGKRNKPNSGLLDKIDGLSVENASELRGDASDDRHTTSTHGEVFTLPDNFQLLKMYDTGDSIKLSDGADHVDLRTLELWKNFGSYLEGSLQTSNSAEMVPIKEMDGITERYKIKLYNNIQTLEVLQEHRANPAHTQKPPGDDDDVCGDAALSQKPYKLPNISAAPENGDGTDTINEDGLRSDVGVICKNAYKVLPKFCIPYKVLARHDSQYNGFDFSSIAHPEQVTGQRVYAAKPHTDDEFLWFFEQELMQFKYADGRKRHGCNTDDDVGVEICKRVCDDRSIHLQDVVQAWGRLSDNTAVVSVLDEIFNRAPRGKADGPKMES
jgi:hypothetical protein